MATGKPSVLILAQLRRLHVYCAMLIAPSLIFFAATGSLQLFSLHEAHGDYTPAPIVEKLASLHKDQEFALGHHQKPPPADAKAPAEKKPPEKEEALKPARLALKAIWAAMALAVIATTALGVWMGLVYNKEKKLLIGLLAAGVAVPVVLTLLG